MAYKTFDEQKGRNVIIVKPLEGSGPVRVLDFPGFPIYRIEQWTKDGLLCLSANSNQIILVPTDGRHPRQLTDVGERIVSFAASPDDRQVAFVRVSGAYEGVMITNFTR